MDELIKKLIDNKDNLISLRLDLKSADYLIHAPDPFDDFSLYGGMVGLSRSYYVFFSYNVNAVLWPQDGAKGIANSIYPLQNINYDALSYSFAGCSMVRFSLNDRWYISHIQSATNPGDDRRKVWIDFFNRNKAKIQIDAMFRPDIDDPIMSDGTKNADLWGLITKERKCYSLYVQHFDKNGRLQRMYDDQKTQRIELQKIKQHDMNGLGNHAQFLDINKWSNWSQNFAQYINDWNTYFKRPMQEVWKRR